MVHNEFIRCEVCGSITRIRLQIGFLDEHPIAVSCGKCGVSLKGKVQIHQEAVGLAFEFENALIISPSCITVSDYMIECSGEFISNKLQKEEKEQLSLITPYLRTSQRMGSTENYEKFCHSYRAIKNTINVWPKYKRAWQLYKSGNREYFVQEIQKLLPKELVQCRNELEDLRAVRMLEIHGFLEPLKPSVVSFPEIGTSIFNLPLDKVEYLIKYLNTHEGYFLAQMQEQIQALLDAFVMVFQYLLPAFSVQFYKDKDIDFETEGTTTSTYEDVKQFYLDAYELLGNLLIIPAAIDNIKYRNDANCFVSNAAGINSLDKFISAAKANRFHLCNQNEIYMRTINASYNQKLRNAIGHNDVEYHPVTQKIVYIPDSKRRNYKKEEYLLKFEMEALSMFQAVLVASEYLYRLRELELMSQGVVPLEVKFSQIVSSRKRIYPNEKCPCGSGIKYKMCHGRRY